MPLIKKDRSRVAELTEHLLLDPRVGGSNLSTRKMFLHQFLKPGPHSQCSLSENPKFFFKILDLKITHLKKICD
jgi:hypothetical protein